MLNQRKHTAMSDFKEKTANKLFEKLDNDFPGFEFSVSYGNGKDYISFDSQCDQYFLSVHYSISSDNWYMVITARRVLFKLQPTQQIAQGLSYEEVKHNLTRIALLGF